MNTQKCPLSEDEKSKMISELAYLKSKNHEQQRDPVADWLQAEDEIEKALHSDCMSRPGFRDHLKTPDQSVYERMRQEATRLLTRAETTLNQETIQLILAKVTAQMRQQKRFLPEAIDRAADQLRGELNGGVKAVRHQWDNLKTRPKKVLADLKDKGNVVLNEKARAFYKWTSKRCDKDHE